MKRILFPLVAVALIAGTSCQERIDIEKEKEAIKAVIENESISTHARDFAQSSKSFLQDESLVYLSASKNGYNYAVGWDSIGRAYKEGMENYPTPSTNKFQFTNYKIKVHGEFAWAVYDQNTFNSEGEFLSHHLETRFLEKVNGTWKIAYLSFINTTSYEEEVENNANVKAQETE